MSNRNFSAGQIGTLKESQPHESQPSAGLLTRNQVARLLGTCVRTVARNTQLAPIKFNARLVRYRAEDVEWFIKAASTGKLFQARTSAGEFSKAPASAAAQAAAKRAAKEAEPK